MVHYLQNMKRVLRSLDNPLKKIENLPQKDRLEREFYDKEAEKHLRDFDEELFLYDENEALPISHQYFYSLLEEVRGKHVLDCCCGYGFTTVKCAKLGALVTGVDISPKMIELAKKNAQFNQVAQRVDLRVMSVEEMSFQNNTFDYAVGLGALHHLNLTLCGREVSRVLKAGGKAIFLEPRIPFKGLIVLRSLVPVKCFESPGGAQLSDREVRQLTQYFSAFDAQYFLFLRKISRLPFFNKFSVQLDRVDCYLLKKFPFLKSLYWAFVLEFTK